MRTVVRMTPLRNMVCDFIRQMTKGGTPAERDEAEQLLARLNSETPRFATPQTQTARKKEPRK